jgi:hypothetical protein
MGTLDYRALFYDRDVDPIGARQSPRIYVFWHEYILLPMYLRGHCDLAMLLSRHRDADILERVAYHLGFDCVRGSTNRGSIAALREMTRRGQHMHLTITPDGPRGPRRRLAQGPIYLASKLQLPLVPLGFGYDRPWRAKSWDRFAVPRPYSRGRAIMGPAMIIPPNLDRSETENCRQRVENLLNRITHEAEAWATSGARRKGEMVARRQGRHLAPRMDLSHPSMAPIPSIPLELQLLPLPGSDPESSTSCQREAG